MSNSNKIPKVLRVALKRIQKGWTKGTWSRKNKQTGVTEICLEGAIYGFSTSNNKNPACGLAIEIVKQIIDEKYPKRFSSIPDFNDDPGTTQAMVEDVVKTALIRAETGGLLRDTEEECWG